MKTPNIEVTTTEIDKEIDKEIVLSHHKELSNKYISSQKNYRSCTPKHQRQINQVDSTEETQSDPPGIDNPENSELKLNHMHCESTDDKSETENTLSINMNNTKNEYETTIISIITKTMKVLITSKNQTIEKSQQIILNNKLKKFQI